MSGEHGGARQNAGRKPNAEKHVAVKASFADECVSHLKPAFWKLWELIEGGERVEVKQVPAGLLTRKGVATDEDGAVILDERLKPTIVEVPIFPGKKADELVTVERKVITLQPDVRAIGELFDRALGKATQAVELTGANGGALEIDATARSEAGRELDAWRKEMTERLSSLPNVPPTMPTSSTPTGS